MRKKQHNKLNTTFFILSLVMVLVAIIVPALLFIFQDNISGDYYKDEQTRANFNLTLLQESSEDYYQIDEYKGSNVEKTVVIPDTYKGLKIRTVGADAFSGNKRSYNTTIVSVVIGDYIKTIGERAFENCDSLKTVVWGNSIEVVGDFAFANCINLEEIDTPSGQIRAKNIGGHAFDSCTKLTSLTFRSGLITIGEQAFAGCSGLEQLSIPSSVSRIGSKAFYNCINIKTLNIPVLGANQISTDSFITIENVQTLTFDGAGTITQTFVENYFGSFINVTNLTIGNFITSVANGSFVTLRNLQTLTIPHNMVFETNSIFSNDAMITELNIVKGNDVPENIYVRRNNIRPLYKANGVLPLSVDGYTVNVGNEIVGIGEEAFYDHTYLNHINLPASLTYISNFAFKRCDSLTDIQIPKSVETLGMEAFRECQLLENINFTVDVNNNSVLSYIGNAAFYGCNAIKKIVIPASVTRIDGSAFSGCAELSTVTFLKSKTPSLIKGLTIGDYAFSGCDKLRYSAYSEETGSGTNFEFPSRLQDIIATGSYSYVIVPAIGEHSFSGCSSLKSIVIPAGVTVISTYAFYGCTGVTYLALTNSVTEILSYAFNDCISLGDLGENNELNGVLTIPSSVTFIGNGAFNFTDENHLNSKITKVIMPCSATVVSLNPLGAGIFYAGLSAYLVNTREVIFNNPLATPAVPITFSMGVGNLFPTVLSVDFVTRANEAGVTEFATDSFRNCNYLEEIGLPLTLRTFGLNNFRNCFKLKTLDIPKNITSLPAYFAYNCPDLTYVNIPLSTESVSGTAFKFDEGSSAIFKLGFKVGLSGGLEYKTLSRILVNSLFKNSGAPFNVAALTHLVVGEGIEEIGSYAFYGFDKLKDLDFSDDLTKIGDFVFEGTDWFNSIQNDLTDANPGHFIVINGILVRYLNKYSTINLVDIPEFVETLKDDGITEDVYITKIIKSAFYGFNELETISLFTAVKGIELNTFKQGTLVYTALTDSFSYTFSGFLNIKEVYVYGTKNLLKNDGVFNIALNNLLPNIEILEFQKLKVAGDTWFILGLGENAITALSKVKVLLIPTGMTIHNTNNISFFASSTSTLIIYGQPTVLGDCVLDYNITALTTGMTHIIIEPSVKAVTAAGKSYPVIIDLGTLSSVNRLTVYTNTLFNETSSFINGGSLELLNINTYGTGNTIVTKAFTDSLIPVNIVHSIAFGDGVTGVGEKAFKDKTLLTEIFVSDEKIDEGYVFKNFGGLCFEGTLWQNITAQNNGGFVVINDVLIRYLPQSAGIKDVVVPHTVISIADRAFYNNIVIEQISLHSGIVYIHNNAFSVQTDEGLSPLYNTNLKTVSLYGNTADTSANVFAVLMSGVLPNVENVIVETTIGGIADNVFKNCQKLKAVSLPHTTEDDELISISVSAFLSCPNLNTIQISGDGEISSVFGNYLFGSSGIFKNHNITKLAISKETDTIEENAFKGISMFTTLEIHSGKDDFGNDVEGLVEIKASAFEDCQNLTNIFAPTTLSKVGEKAFWGTGFQASGGGAVIINNVLYRYENADVDAFVVPVNVKKITEGAFSLAVGLKSVSLTPSLVSIHTSAFALCVLLENLIVYSSSTDDYFNISVNSFIPNVKNIKILPGVAGFEADTLGNLNYLEMLETPADVGFVSAGNSAFTGGVSSLSIIKITAGQDTTSVVRAWADTLPYINGEIIIDSSVLSIGTGAFNNLSHWDGINKLHICLTTTGINANDLTGFSAMGSLLIFGVSNEKIITKSFVDKIAGLNVVTTLLIGNNIESIGERAFENFTSLESVNLGNVETVGKDSFKNLLALGAVTFPETLPAIAEFAFDGTSWISGLAEHNNGFAVIDEGKYLLRYLGTSADVVVPAGVLKIGVKALDSNLSVQTITLDSSINYIETDAFNGCANFNKIVFTGNGLDIFAVALSSMLPASVQNVFVKDGAKLANNSLAGCSNLKNITISIGAAVSAAVFDGCTNLTSWRFVGSNSPGLNGTLSRGFIDTLAKNLLINVEIDGYNDGTSDPVTAVAAGAFTGAVNLKNVSVGGNVLSFGTIEIEATSEDGVFSGCSVLETVVFNNTALVSFGKYAFYNCEALKDIVIPANLQTINSFAFANCVGLSYFGMPESLTTIENNAFERCTGLTSVILLSNISTFGSNSFAGCTGITELTVPIFSFITESVFSGCNNISELRLLGKVGLSNFLTNVQMNNIPAANVKTVYIDYLITRIEENCFNNYTGLREVVFEVSEAYSSNLLDISTSAFTNCNQLKTITVPNGVDTFRNVFDYAISITIIGTGSITRSFINQFQTNSIFNLKIGGAITAINSLAFVDCNNIKVIEFMQREVTEGGGLLALTINSNPFIFLEDDVVKGSKNVKTLIVPNGTSMAGIGNLGFNELVITNGSGTQVSTAFTNTIPALSVEKIVVQGSLISSIQDDAFNSFVQFKELCVLNGFGGNLSGIAEFGKLTIIGEGNVTGATFENLFVITDEKYVSSINELEISEGILSVQGTSIFNKFESLSSIIIPSGLVFGSGVLLNASRITRLRITGTETLKIDWINSLQKNDFAVVEIDESITQIESVGGVNAFDNFNLITELILPNGLENASVVLGAPLLKKLTILGSGEITTSFVTPLNTQITHLTLGEYVSSVQNNAFATLSSLTHLSLYNVVGLLGSDNVLQNKNTIQHLTILGDGVISRIFVSKLNYSTIKNLVIGEGITGISYNAFMGMINLETVYLPTSLETIESSVYSSQGAFLGNTKLKNVIFENGCGVKHIGSYAFSNTGFETFEVWDSVHTLGDFSFYNCYYLKSVNIVGGIEIIGEGTFAGCLNLLTVSLPSSLIIIGGSPDGFIKTDSQVVVGAFEGCNLLNNISMGGLTNLTTIADRTFTGCTNLLNVSLPNSVVYVGSSAFDGSAYLTNVYAVNANNVFVLDNRILFKYQPGGSVNNHASLSTVLTIYNGVFENISASAHISYIIGLLGNVTGISQNAFRNFSLFPSSSVELTNIIGLGDNAFMDSNIENIVIGGSVKYWGVRVFSGCTDLYYVAFDIGLTGIGEYAFDNCSSLETIFIPYTVMTIGARAFDGCTSIASVVFESTDDDVLNLPVTIERYAFNNCSLVNVVIPRGAHIKSSAFYGITTLTSLELNINSSVQSGAFDSCDNLNSLVFSGTGMLTKALIDSVVQSSIYIKKVYVRSEVSACENNAFMGLNLIEELYIYNTGTVMTNLSFNSNALNTPAGVKVFVSSSLVVSYETAYLSSPKVHIHTIV